MFYNAGRTFGVCVRENFTVSSGVCPAVVVGKDSEVKQLIAAFKSYYHSSEVYHIYHAIQRFTVSVPLYSVSVTLQYTVLYVHTQYVLCLIIL